MSKCKLIVCEILTWLTPCEIITFVEHKNDYSAKANHDSKHACEKYPPLTFAICDIMDKATSYKIHPYTRRSRFFSFSFIWWILMGRSWRPFLIDIETMVFHFSRAQDGGTFLSTLKHHRFGEQGATYTVKAMLFPCHYVHEWSQKQLWILRVLFSPI